MAGHCATCATGVALASATQCYACWEQAAEVDDHIDHETWRMQRLAIERYYSGRIDGAHRTLLEYVTKLERLRSASGDDIAREYHTLFTVPSKLR
jgi:hypothetical protein